MNAPRTCPNSSEPGVLAGDLDGDGRTDLVAVVYGSGNLGVLPSAGVLPGNGDGSFRNVVQYDEAGQYTPQWGDIGDLDGNGKPDVVMAASNASTPGVTVFVGNGDGTLRTGVDYATPSPAFVTIYDVNGDGKPDILAGNNADQSVSVLLGNGDGTFKASSRIAGLPSRPQLPRLGDLNGDGKPDIVVATTTTFYFLAGNGDGTFLAPVSIGGPPSLLFAIVDLDGDGKLDLATSAPTVMLQTACN